MNKLKQVISGNEKLIGYASGFLAIIFYSIISILGQKADVYKGEMDIYIYGITFVVVKEFAATFSYMICSKNPLERIKVIYRTIKNETKMSIFASIAGIFGGVIGYSLTTIGSIYVGSAFSSPFFSIEIVIVLAVMLIFFKRRPNKFQVIGVAIITIGVILIPIFNEVFYSHESLGTNVLLGTILVILGVVAWSVESILFDVISNESKTNINIFVAIKQSMSFFVGLLIILPLFSLFHNLPVSQAYVEFGSIFSDNWPIIIFAFAAGLLLYIGRILFFSSLRMTGATTANAIYNSITFIQPSISYIAFAIDQSVNYVGPIHHEYFWALNILILIGLSINIYGQIKSNGIRI